MTFWLLTGRRYDVKIIPDHHTAFNLNSLPLMSSKGTNCLLQGSSQKNIELRRSGL